MKLPIHCDIETVYFIRCVIFYINTRVQLSGKNHNIYSHTYLFLLILPSVQQGEQIFSRTRQTTLADVHPVSYTPLWPDCNSFSSSEFCSKRPARCVHTSRPRKWRLWELQIFIIVVLNISICFMIIIV